MIPSMRHYPSFGGPKGRVNYGLSEGRDRSGNLRELEPGRDPRWELLGARGFDFEVTDRESALRAAAEMDRLAGDRGFSNKGYTKDGPVLEMSMAWHPIEDERTNEHMLHAADSAIEALGMRDAQRVVIRHREKEHQHLHVIANRIHPVTREVFPWRNDRVIMREWSKAYERDHGMVRDRAYVRTLEQERAREREGPAQGYTRLYRAEPRQHVRAPEWVEQGLRASGALDARGRWFVQDRSLLEWYINDQGGPEKSRVIYRDVPSRHLEDYRVSNNEGARKFSRDPQNEFYLPREVADGRPYVPERTHIRDVSAFPRTWLKTAEQYRAMEDEDERGLAPLEPDEVRALRKEWSREPKRVYERGYPHRHYERERSMVPPEVTQVGAPPREHSRSLNENPGAESDHHGGGDLHIPNPLGNPFPKYINRILSDDESHLAQEKGLERDEVTVVRMKRTHERGGRERTPWFDDGGASGQSGFSGE